ncbi:hypothetical protein EDB89DRAFT_2228581 [Lactarius sanguifluus]|nr:hypothetical protein EDB89DRAFT_2228581 [Lactarius sanguifluus]
MAKWDDPVLVLRDYFVLTKLFHALASLFIWETVFSAGFELGVLRGKRPYKWTIWLYLGSRYTLVLVFIIFYIDNDANPASRACQPIITANFALSYISWGFASLIIVLRVQVIYSTAGDPKVLNVARFRIAIWGRNIVVSSIALSMWLAGLGVHIRSVTMIETTYNSVFRACIVLKTQDGLASVIAIFVVDTTLLVLMLIGLLRHTHASGSSTGIWHLLYKQCIIWMILAAIAEIPSLVFLILNLNDPWNNMFPAVGITILSICAARMYRSLSKHGSLTEYSSDPPPRFPPGLPLSNYQGSESRGVHSTMHSTTIGVATVSDGTMADPSVFIPAEQIQLESVPGASNTVLAVPSQTKSKDMPDYQMSWHRAS